MTAREQCIEMIGEEFTKKWETLPPELKMVMAGITKQTSASKHHVFTPSKLEAVIKRKNRIRNNTQGSKYRLPMFSLNQRLLFQTLKLSARPQSNNSKTQPRSLSIAKSKILHPKTIQRPTEFQLLPSKFSPTKAILQTV